MSNNGTPEDQELSEDQKFENAKSYMEEIELNWPLMTIEDKKRESKKIIDAMEIIKLHEEKEKRLVEELDQPLIKPKRKRAKRKLIK